MDPSPSIIPRLAAVALVAIVTLGYGTACGNAEEPADSFTPLSVAQPPAEPAPAHPPLPDVTDPLLTRGKAVWLGTCVECHGTGMGDAPIIGEKAAWAPRITQGLPTLQQHARDGFWGKIGEMPARGGNPDLSDDDVNAAVAFMVYVAEPDAVSTDTAP